MALRLALFSTIVIPLAYGQMPTVARDPNTQCYWQLAGRHDRVIKPEQSNRDFLLLKSEVNESKRRQ